ncbi:MAG: ABC transporter, permease protein 2 (cluster 1, maltose/g3p/polyamine/iron), partial [uncultured Frankineae bacterium]
EREAVPVRDPAGARRLLPAPAVRHARVLDARRPRGRARPDRLAGHRGRPAARRRDRHLAAAGGAHERADAGPAAADDGVGAPAGAGPAPARRVPLPAAARHPRGRARRRHRAAVLLGDVLPRRLGPDADLRLRRAGAAVRLPRARVGPDGHGPQDAVGGRAQPRRRLGHRAAAGGAAGRARRGAVGGPAHRGARARRVHARLPAELPEPAGRGEPHRQARRGAVDRRLARCPPARLRPAARPVDRGRPTPDRPRGRAAHTLTGSAAM